MRTTENIPKLSVSLFAYNLVMLAALVGVGPMGLPIWLHQEKRRRTLLNRLMMQSIPTSGEGCPCGAPSKRVWIHALSVGEVLSAEPLVRAMARQVGRANLVFTASTFTGFQTARRVIAPYVCALRYFPYDTIFSVDRALAVMQPRRVVIVETDIWPNFLVGLKKRGIPVDLVNARLSDRSYRGYRRLSTIMQPLLSIFRRICTQTDTDRQRFLDLGVHPQRLITAGNIKFDQAPPDVAVEDIRQLAKRLCLPEGRFVWVAGSTHAGEEDLLAQAYQVVCARGMTPVMIVAPRDPGRAADVCRCMHRRGLEAVTLGALESRSHPRPIVVIDRIGLLRRLYALADVAFVGGSLIKAGGHNPLEPASVAKPILFGPHTDDFRWICRTLEEAGGALRVGDPDQIARIVTELMVDSNKRAQIGRHARAVFERHRGAVQRTLAVIAAADGASA